MSELTKKYLGEVAVEALVTNVKAEDQKILAAAKAHAEGLAPNYDAAGTAQTKANEALESSKAYTDELANGQVKLNKEAIEKLNGSDTTEGSVAKAVKDAKDALQENIDAVEDKADKNAEDIAAINNTETGILKQAKDYTDAEVEKVQGSVDELAEKVGEVPEGKTVMDIITNIQENAYDDTELRGLITGLDTNKADKEQVATDIADAVKVEEDARKEAVQGVQDAVDALSGTHATDKKALEDAIALKADQTALDELAEATATKTELQAEVKRAQDEEARIEGLVGTEQARAEGVESGLDTRLKAVEDDYLKAADKTELQGQITANANAITLLTDGVDAEKVDGVKDLINYVEEHGTEVTGMKEDIAGNTEAIEGVAGRMTTAEGKITSLEEAVAKKVEQTAYDTKIGELEAADAGIDERLQAVETQLGDGEGSVADQISEAEQRAKDAAAADATTKANTAETNAKAHADSLNTAMDARVDALEAIDHEHANKELLDTYTQTEADLADAVAKKHEHTNAEVLDGITAEKVAAWDAAEKNAKDYADGLNSAMDSRVDALEADTHTHTNKAELDKFVDGDKAKLDDAVAKAHEHANKAELDKVAEGDVAKWNAAEQNAKDFATGLNTAMDGRMTAVETKASENADAIADLTTTHNEDKETLQAAIDANTSAINSFVAISAEEINAMFA